MTVVTAQSKELRPIYMRFQKWGCMGLDYDATPPLGLMRTLRNHLLQNGVVFLLGDFFRPQFPQATMFQRITRSPGGAAALALELQVPVIPFFGHRTRGFRHRLVFHQPMRRWRKRLFSFRSNGFIGLIPRAMGIECDSEGTTW
jgi:KDO2-lipid IV(A) lauroyltransferase